MKAPDRRQRELRVKQQSRRSLAMIEACTSIEQPGWLELREALWPQCSRDEHLAEMASFLAAPHRYAQFVAYTVERRPIGFAEASVRTDHVNGTTSSPVAFLEGLYVAPASRRRGTAAALVAAVSAWARRVGCRELASDALLHNQISHAVHRALSFEETERVVFFRKALGPQPPETLVTDRLVLRRPVASDAAAVYEYGRDPDVTRYLVFRTHTSPADAETFIATCRTRWESGEEYCWLITDPRQQAAIGSIACRVRGHAVDIGYALARAHWGHGYATEAGRAVVAWAAELPGIHRVWAVCDVANTRSARVLEKLGLSPEGLLRRWLIHPNVSPVPRDCYVYARVRGDG